MSDKTSHLQMIQGVVSRLAGNSFSVKGWSLSLVTAVLAFSKTIGGAALLVAAVPAIFFWGLDAYFLSCERRFRALYDEVRAKGADQIDFSMRIGGYRKGKYSLGSAWFSVTLVLFHGGLLAAILIAGVSLGLVEIKL